VQINGGLNWADIGFLSTGGPEQIGTRTAAFSSISAAAVWRRADDSRWTWGLAIYSPYSLAVQWPEDWDGRLISQEIFINSMYFMPSASFKLSETFSLGLAAGVGLTNLAHSRALNVTPDANSMPHAELNGRRIAGRVHAGFVWEASYNLRLAMSYQAEWGPKEIDGEASFVIPASLENDFPNTDFSFNLPAPSELRLGLVYKVDPDWELLCDLHWQNWVVMDSFLLDYSSNTDRLLDDSQVWAWRNTLAIRAGSVWDIGGDSRLLAGLAFEPDPIANNSLTPIIPDASRISLSAGFSTQIQEHLGLQIAASYRLSGERLGAVPGRDFGGTYQLQDISAQIGLNWRW
jgi:long-chain fatty acid transport protein